jgi:hypothetical protein
MVVCAPANPPVAQEEARTCVEKAAVRSLLGWWRAWQAERKRPGSNSSSDLSPPGHDDHDVPIGVAVGAIVQGLIELEVQPQLQRAKHWAALALVVMCTAAGFFALSIA